MITVGVIGLGNIAHGYDDNPNVKRRIRYPTHLSVLKKNRHFKLVGGADPSRDARKAFARKAHVPVYSDYKTMLRASKPEMIVIATPTATHYSICMEVLRWGVDILLCEKPVAYSARQGREMLVEAQTQRTVFAVNYFRSYDSGYVKLAKLLEKGTWGRVKAIDVNYAGGVFNTASHMIQLMTKFFGKAQSVFVIQKNPAEKDPTHSFVMQYDGFAAVYHGIDTKYYRIFEADILFEKGRLRIASDTLTEYGIKSEAGFSFLHVSKKPHVILDIGESMLDVYSNVYHASRGGALLCSPDDALYALEVAEQVAKK